MRLESPMRRHNPVTLAGLCLLLVAGAATAQDCNPGRGATRFTLDADGTATDPATGLTWRRCSEDQTWDGTTCAGEAALHDWRQAMALGGGQAGAGGWRLPTLDELASVVEKTCTRPAIDPEVFPATAPGVFWSATSDGRNDDYAWNIHFRDGHPSKIHKSRGGNVRLVRGDPDFPTTEGSDTPRPPKPQ